MKTRPKKAELGLEESLFRKGGRASEYRGCSNGSEDLRIEQMSASAVARVLLRVAGAQMART